MSTLLVDRVAHNLGMPSASTGYFPTKAMIVNSLNEGARIAALRLIPDAIPEHVREQSASYKSVSYYSLPSDYLKDIDLYCETDNTKVRKYPAYLRTVLVDSNSMHYGKTGDFAFCYINNKIRIFNAASASNKKFLLTYIGEPKACSATTSENYASWNKDLEELSIDYGVIRGKEGQVGDNSEKFKSSLVLAKSKTASAMLNFASVTTSILSISSISSLDSLLPSSASLSISAFTPTISISSVSFPTAPSISSISSLSAMNWSTTRILSALNSASRAASIITTQLGSTIDDHEKAEQYLNQAGGYINQAVQEISNERGRFEAFGTQINKAIGKLQIDVDVYYKYFSGKLDRAVQHVVNSELKPFSDRQTLKLEQWSGKVQKGIEKYKAQISRYQANVEKELGDKRLLLDKAGAKLTAARTEIETATAYIGNNTNILAEVKALEEQYEKRITTINGRFGAVT